MTGNKRYNLRNLTLQETLKLPDRYLKNITHDQLIDCLEKDNFTQAQIDDIVNPEKTIIEIIKEQRIIEEFDQHSQSKRRKISKELKEYNKAKFDEVPEIDLGENGHNSITSDEIKQIALLSESGWKNKGMDNITKAIFLLRKGANINQILAIDSEQFLDKTVDDLIAQIKETKVVVEKSVDQSSFDEELTPNHKTEKLEDLINQPGLSRRRNPNNSPLGTGHKIILDNNERSGR